MGWGGEERGPTEEANSLSLYDELLDAGMWASHHCRNIGCGLPPGLHVAQQLSQGYPGGWELAVRARLGVLRGSTGCGEEVVFCFITL